MRALVFDGSSVQLEERDVPRVEAGFALVRVLEAGVCNTDLEIARGYMGFRGVLGHEFLGEVVEGPETWRGTRVVSEINFACGHCASCAAGLGRHCPTRRVMGILDADGAFAEHVAVPVANLHRVPEALPDASAVFAEPLAAAFEIVEQVEVAQRSVVVLGDGKLGLLVSQVLANSGARVLAVGHHEAKLAILERRGIETRLEADWQPKAESDLVVDATGSERGLRQAIAATRPRGTLVLKSTVAAHAEINLAPVVINEIRIVGSRCGPFEPALRALAQGDVDVESLVEERFALADSVAAFERAGRRGAGKILISTG